MGADMLAAAVVVDKNKTLDWTAVERALAGISDDELEKRLDEVGMEIEAARAEVQALFVDLMDAIENQPRGVTTIEVRGATVYLTGGMSWGDDPTEEFSTFDKVGYFPEILTAVGFEPPGHQGYVKIRF